MGWQDANLTMFVRNKAKLDPELQDQNVIVGDATNSADLEAAIKGQDIVYASLAGNVVDEAKKIVAAMDKQGVKRLIWTSSLGIYDEVPGQCLPDICIYIIEKRYKQAVPVAVFIKLAARKPTRLVLPDEGGNDHLIL